MTRLFHTGFEGGYSPFPNQSGTPTLDAATKAHGSYAVSLDSSEWVSLVLTATKQEIYGRVYIRHSSATTASRDFFELYDAGTLQFAFRYSSGNMVTAYRGSTLIATGTIPCPVDTWSLFEFRIKIDDTVGVVTTKVNGVQDIAFSGDTQQTANAYFNEIRLNALSTSAGATYSTWFDDVAFNDISGSVNQSWIGDGRIIGLTPTGAGTYTGLSVYPSGANWEAVDEKPPNDGTDYVYDTVADEKDTYALSNTGLGAGTVNALLVFARAQKSDAGDGKIAIMVRSGSTDSQGADQSLSSLAWQNFWQVWELDPADSAAWTLADLDALEAGVVAR
jgi:hypothetical protein